MNLRTFVSFVIALSMLGCEPDSKPAVPEAKEAPAAVPPKTDPFQARAEALITAFQGRLQKALQAAMAEGGPVHSIGVCAEQAPAIAAELSQGGLEIHRVGTRVRNAKTNMPTAAQRAELTKLDHGRDSFTGVLDGEKTHMKAIFIGNPMCLTCHGDGIAPPVAAALEASYPDDEATGYQMGDLRGAFVVTER